MSLCVPEKSCAKSFKDENNHLTSKKVLVKGILWNLIGKFMPMMVAFLSIPFVIKGVGIEKFGILTLIWSVIGYSSLFDLGLGRALTQLVSKKIGENDTQDLPGLIWTGIFLLFCLSLFGSLVLSLNAGFIASKLLKVSSDYLPECINSIYFISLCLPVFFISSACGGVLASYQKFGVINAVNIPLAVLNFIGPLIILPFTKELNYIVASLVLGRIISMVLFFYFCGKIVENFYYLGFKTEYVKKMLKFGGWVTVSSIISPIMVTFDRFFISNILSASVVAYYTTPYEVTTRMLIVPGCIVSVMFPAFSKELTSDPLRAKRMFVKSLKYTILILAVPCTALFFFAKPALSLWINAEFASKSYLIAQTLAVGVLIVGSSYIPYNFIQAMGRSDITAKFHLIELPFYILTLFMLVKTFGITGAAYAWTGRVLLDAILLQTYSTKLFRTFQKKLEA
jgi:O-antigen/teichoic acid export membrane protein